MPPPLPGGGKPAPAKKKGKGMPSLPGGSKKSAPKAAPAAQTFPPHMLTALAQQMVADDSTHETTPRPGPPLPGKAAAPMPTFPAADKKKPALPGKPALPAKTAPRPRADTGAGMALGSAPMPVLPGKKAMPALPVGVEEEDEEDEEEEDEEAHMRGETYEVVQTVALCEGSSIDSKKVGNLKTGETVTALKVEMVDGHTRVQIKRKKKKKKVWASAV